MSACGWAVVDLETTGLFPSIDRVVEVAVVSLEPGGRVTDAWETVIDPQRDLGPTHIHGLTTRQVSGAPVFADIAPELLWRLSDRVLVAHNVRFEMGFLRAEIERAGWSWPPIQGLCTMELAGAARVWGRSLPDCCEALGIPLEHHHAAAEDALAAAAIFMRLLGRVRFTAPAPAPPCARPSCPCSTRARTDPPLPRVPSGTAALASRVGVPEGIAAPPGAATAYLDLLDRVLEDRRISEMEEHLLEETARGWGISAAAAAKIHRAYTDGAWGLALDDGRLTQAELDDLAMLAELLGVPLERPSGPTQASPQRSHDLAGMAVCFTGASVCSIDGAPLGRRDQERLAEQAGLRVKQGVSGRLDILVLADPDSMSSKAREARDSGVRCITEPVFWRMVGVPID